MKKDCSICNQEGVLTCSVCGWTLCLAHAKKNSYKGWFANKSVCKVCELYGRDKENGYTIAYMKNTLEKAKKKYKIVGKIKIQVMVRRPKNFPTTICKSETGYENNNSSVPIFFSSAKDFIVRIGINKRSKTVILDIKSEKTPSVKLRLLTCIVGFVAT